MYNFQVVIELLVTQKHGEHTDNTIGSLGTSFNGENRIGHKNVNEYKENIISVPQSIVNRNTSKYIDLIYEQLHKIVECTKYLIKYVING